MRQLELVSPKSLPIVWSAFDCCARLRRVLAHVIAHPDETLSLAGAASIAAMDDTYFSEFFHVQVGVSFKYWIDFVRIQRAAAVLGRSDESITRIALDCGFADTTTFTRTFQRIAGMTPIQYRRRCHEIARCSWQNSEETPKNSEETPIQQVAR
jgi:AraC-like DNA-binding protein